MYYKKVNLFYLCVSITMFYLAFVVAADMHFALRVVCYLLGIGVGICAFHKHLGKFSW